MSPVYRPNLRSPYVPPRRAYNLASCEEESPPDVSPLCPSMQSQTNTQESEAQTLLPVPAQQEPLLQVRRPFPIAKPILTQTFYTSPLTNQTTTTSPSSNTTAPSPSSNTLTTTNTTSPAKEQPNRPTFTMPTRPRLPIASTQPTATPPARAVPPQQTQTTQTQSLFTKLAPQPNVNRGWKATNPNLLLNYTQKNTSARATPPTMEARPQAITQTQTQTQKQIHPKSYPQHPSLSSPTPTTIKPVPLEGAEEKPLEVPPQKTRKRRRSSPTDFDQNKKPNTILNSYFSPKNFSSVGLLSWLVLTY